MAYVITTKTPTVDFKINGYDFEVDGTDEKLMSFNQKYNELLTRANLIKTNLQENENLYQNLVEDAMDELLGEGAFENLYQETPSVIILFDILNQITAKLMLEMTRRVEIEEINKTPNDNPKKAKLFGGK